MTTIGSRTFEAGARVCWTTKQGHNRVGVVMARGIAPTGQYVYRVRALTGFGAKFANIKSHRLFAAEAA